MTRGEGPISEALETEEMLWLAVRVGLNEKTSVSPVLRSKRIGARGLN